MSMGVYGVMGAFMFLSTCMYIDTHAQAQIKVLIHACISTLSVICKQTGRLLSNNQKSCFCFGDYPEKNMLLSFVLL